jgi:hypothetical protein
VHGHSGSLEQAQGTLREYGSGGGFLKENSLFILDNPDGILAFRRILLYERKPKEPVIQFLLRVNIPSGAKARVDFAGFMYGLKPIPFNTST